jgi:V8-like Glu-specific endopeptidase
MRFILITLAVSVFLNSHFALATVFLNSQSQDPRQDMTGTNMPWSSIGRLIVPSFEGDDQSFCTGTLVGKRLVLTAAHCVINNHRFDPARNTLRTNIVFQPNFQNGVSSDSANVVNITVGTMDVYSDEANDWAVLVLDKDLGTKYGTMDVESMNSRALPMTVQTAGYSHDYKNGLTAGKILDCQILGTAQGFFKDRGDTSTVFQSNCSGTEGASGSPLFHQIESKYVIAVIFSANPTLGDVPLEVTSYSLETANINSTSDLLIQAVQTARQKYE